MRKEKRGRTLLALPFMVPREVCPGRMARVVLIGWFIWFQNSNGKTIPALNNGLKFFLLHFYFWTNNFVFYCRERKTTMLMYKNIICFFSFPFITQNVWLDEIRERQRWLKCTQAEAAVCFFCETSLFFCFVVLGWNLPWFIWFSRYPCSHHVHTSYLHTARGHAPCLACHPCNLCGTSVEEIPAFCLL